MIWHWICDKMHCIFLGHTWVPYEYAGGVKYRISVCELCGKSSRETQWVRS